MNNILKSIDGKTASESYDILLKTYDEDMANLIIAVIHYVMHGLDESSFRLFIDFDNYITDFANFLIDKIQYMPPIPFKEYKNIKDAFAFAYHSMGKEKMIENMKIIFKDIIE